MPFACIAGWFMYWFVDSFRQNNKGTAYSAVCLQSTKLISMGFSDVVRKLFCVDVTVGEEAAKYGNVDFNVTHTYIIERQFSLWTRVVPLVVWSSFPNDCRLNFQFGQTKAFYVLYGVFTPLLYTDGGRWVMLARGDIDLTLMSLMSVNHSLVSVNCECLPAFILIRFM